MNKYIKKSMLIILIMFIGIFLTGCKNTFEVGNLLYYGNEEDGYTVYGYSKRGQSENYIVIPNTYGNFDLKLHIFNPLIGQNHFDSSESIKRVYFESNHKYIDGEVELKNGKVMMFSADSEPFIKNECYRGSIYLSYKTYIEYAEYNNIDLEEKLFTAAYLCDEYRPANLSYYYNYEDAPNNGYYFIDDYDDELISYIPKNPERNGYIFMGWYKEAECINKWDFEKDKVPEKEYIINEGNEKAYKYKETILYAKWG